MQANKGRVLIVEDDISLADLYEMVMKAHGYKVVGKAVNGKEAVNLYKTLLEKPDVVLMDHRMPIKTGLEATREILEYDSQAKIIIATADKNVQAQMKELNVQSFKNKPFSNAKLIDNIQKAINGANSEAVIQR